jgi:hypothetical protein
VPRAAPGQELSLRRDGVLALVEESHERIFSGQHRYGVRFEGNLLRLSWFGNSSSFFEDSLRVKFSLPNGLLFF